MRRLKFFLLFSAALGLFGASLYRFPVPLRGALQLARAAAADGVLLLAALAWGRGLLQPLRLFHRSWKEELIFSLSLGLLGLSLLGSLLGALGLLYDWVLALLVALLLIIHWEHLEHFGRELRRDLYAKQPWEGGRGRTLAFLAGALGLLAMLVLCLAPVSFYDALNYHLAGVHRAAQLGRELPQAHNFYTWLPSLAQPLWTMASLLSGLPLLYSFGPSLLNAAMALLLGLALVEASNRWLEAGGSALATALAWTQPVLVLSFGVFGPDGWMAAFAFLSFFAYLAADTEEDLARQGAWLGLAALFAGAACAAKPVAFLHVASLGALCLWQLWRRAAWRRWRWLAWAAFLLCLPLLPWLLRGAWYRHNPVFPFWIKAFGHSFLQGGPPDYFETMKVYGGPWWRLPWDFFFEPGSMGGNGHLSWFLLALGLSALGWRFSTPQKQMAAYLLLSLALWTLGPWVLRFWLFAVPVACLLAAHGAQQVEAWAPSKGWLRGWTALVLAGLFLGAGQCLLTVTKDFQPWSVAMGLQDPVAYLAERRVPQAEAAAWIAKRPKPWRVLELGDARTAYLPPQSLAASPFDVHPFRAWAAQAKSPQDLSVIVRRKGYDLLIVGWSSWEWLSDSDDPPYWAKGDLATAERVNSWLQSLAQDPERPRLELSQRGGWVFDLR